MAPVNLCIEEDCFDGGCTNKFIVEHEAAVVQTKSRSVVGVMAYTEPKCQCAASMVEAVEGPQRCRPTSCLNNGTCVESWGDIK